eukprot:gene41677-51642_t
MCGANVSEEQSAKWLNLEKFMSTIAEKCMTLQVDLDNVTDPYQLEPLMNKPGSVMKLLLASQDPPVESQLLLSCPTHHIKSAEIFLLMFRHFQMHRDRTRMLFYATRYFNLFNDLMGELTVRSSGMELFKLTDQLCSMKFDSESPWTPDLMKLSVELNRRILCLYKLTDGERGVKDAAMTSKLREVIMPFLTRLPAEPNKLTECMLCGETPERVAITLNRCGRCGQVAYCSKGCQKEHWKVHKKGCKK